MSAHFFPNPSVVLVGGVPGSGKSYLLDHVKTSRGTFVTSADHVRGKVQEAHGFSYDDYREDLIPEAREVFFTALDGAVDRGENIINEGTYLTEHSIAEMVAFAQKNSYSCSLLLVKASIGQCLGGVTRRERSMGLTDVLKYWRRFRRLEQQLLDGGLMRGLSGATIITRETPVEGLYFA